MSMSQSSCLLMVARAENVRMVEYVGSYENSKNGVFKHGLNSHKIKADSIILFSKNVVIRGKEIR